MNNLIPILKYVWLTLKHKYFVFLAGRKIDCPVHLLLLHDLSKFSPFELPYYGRQFFGDRSRPLQFSLAWNHHQKSNKHHWEYWVPITGHNRGGYGDLEPLPMPKKYVCEMVADWIGASRVYEGKWPSLNKWDWFDKNFKRIKLHSETRQLVIKILADSELLL